LSPPRQRFNRSSIHYVNSGNYGDCGNVLDLVTKVTTPFPAISYFRFRSWNSGGKAGLVSASREIPMNTMHRRVFLAVAAAFALLPWTASAQDSQPSDRPAQPQQWQQLQRRVAVLAQRLNLTKEQKRQWVQINRETTEKVWAARKDDSLNEMQMQARLREIHKQQKQQILALLTPEQLDALKAYSQEQKQKQQQNKPSDSSGNSSNGSSAQSSDNSSDQDDDLFAGMVSDDPAPAQPAQTKKTTPK
jgi:Spy/CpxP family protein refolding chaperone